MSTEISPIEKKATSPEGVTQPGHAAVDHDHEHDAESHVGFEKPVADDGAVVDAVWGRIEAGKPNYRALSWWGASVLLTKIQVSRLKHTEVPKLIARSGWASWACPS